MQILIGVVIVLGVIALIGNLTGHKPPAQPNPAQGMSTSTAVAQSPLSVTEAPSAPAPSPTPTMVSQSEYYIFQVTGTGPAPRVEYGTNAGTPGSDVTVTGKLPWSFTETDMSESQYLLSATGPGTYKANITEVVTTKCSNETSHTSFFDVASDGPSSDPAISVFPSFGDNLAQAEQDAGC